MSQADRSSNPVALGPTLLAAARFRASAYRTIADDRRFWGATLVIVTLGAASHAGLGIAWATAGGWAPIRSIVPAALSQFVVWLGLSCVAWVVGRTSGSDATLAGVLRAVGVASLPAAIYVLGIFPPLLWVMGAWWIAATFVALRGSLGLSTPGTVVALAAGAVVGYLMAGLTTISVLALLV